MSELPARCPERGLGRASRCRYSPAMTVVWAALIVVGIVMILAAVWPSVRGGPDSGKKE